MMVVVLWLVERGLYSRDSKTLYCGADKVSSCRVTLIL